MSANYVVDLNAGVDKFTSQYGAYVYAASGTNIGLSCDLINTNTFTNLLIAGVVDFQSGPLRFVVQTSDTDVSGNYTDPTSGLAQLPTVFTSGSVVTIQSGGGVFGPPVSGQASQSGFIAFAGFQRPHRFARVLALSGDLARFAGNTGFVAQLKTTGSGGGFTLAPTSGTINV